jgi:hypothetical protein
MASWLGEVHTTLQGAVQCRLAIAVGWANDETADAQRRRTAAASGMGFMAGSLPLALIDTADS